MRAKSGFTLVEILIVVVILGILAAIVIPQFTDASTQARESSLSSDLQMLRSQVELYKVQHNDKLTAITDNTSFLAQITSWTDIDGGAKTGPGANTYGPYMQKVPQNPFNDKNTVRVETGAATNTAGANTDGWVLNTTTGVIRADDDKLCPDTASTPHKDL